MTLRLDMRKAVSRAEVLETESRDAVVEFLLRQLNEDGGFRGRSESSDLYYSTFALEALLALDANVPLDRIYGYLRSFGHGNDLDFIHLACLVRSLTNLAEGSGMDLQTAMSGAILANLQRYRSVDGAFATSVGAEAGSAYACFFALGVYQDLEAQFDVRDPVLECLERLKIPDGGFANDSSTKLSSTPATAAAVSILHYLQEPIPGASIEWLAGRAHPEGGFTPIAFASDSVIPDLLSTATALHSLRLAGASVDKLREDCLDFLDSLWSREGGFQGSWADDIVDCEYTYYGLLALGHLSEE